MYWNEDKEDNTTEVVDISFKIDCKTLRIDHAWVLSQALLDKAPWLSEEPLYGLHPVYISESGNGWQRPEGEKAEIHLSKRARVGVRLPKSRVDDAKSLTGIELDIYGHSLKIGKASVKALLPMPTIQARYILSDEDKSEDQFIEYVANELQKLHIPVRKLLCGKSGVLNIDGKKQFFRSIMVADLNKEHSLLLQHRGIGPYREVGCGIFIPHKGISSIAKDSDD